MFSTSIEFDVYDLSTLILSFSVTCVSSVTCCANAKLKVDSVFVVFHLRTLGTKVVVELLVKSNIILGL